MMLLPYWIICTKSIKKSYENGHTFSVELFWLFIFASDVYLNIMNDSLDDLNHTKFYFNPHMVYNWHQINIIQNHFPVWFTTFQISPASFTWKTQTNYAMVVRWGTSEMVNRG